MCIRDSLWNRHDEPPALIQVGLIPLDNLIADVPRQQQCCIGLGFQEHAWRNDALAGAGDVLALLVWADIRNPSDSLRVETETVEQNHAFRRSSIAGD